MEFILDRVIFLLVWAIKFVLKQLKPAAHNFTASCSV